jgi:LemA protein
MADINILVILGAGALALLLVCLLILVSVYNTLTRLKQNRESAFANVDVQLVHRHDVIPQLVETAKAYVDHENRMLKGINEALRAGVAADNIEDKIAADRRLSAALFGFMTLSESNPELRADEKFKMLMHEIADTENKLAAARRFFNAATKEYNTACELFPNIVFAPMLGHYKSAWFDVADSGIDRAHANKRPNIEGMM